MNERIKQLAEQATSIQGPTPYNPLTFEVFDKEKFAKLIITECIDWCNAHARDDGTAQRIAQDIKKDFGVES
jgi:hypothetical protein